MRPTRRDESGDESRLVENLQVTLEQMCGEGEMEGQLRMLEDGGRFLDVKMAPRPRILQRGAWF